MQRKYLPICLILFAVILFACRKETEKPSWDTHDIAPLVGTSLNINNLIPDSILKTNPDSSLKIVYKNNLFKFSMDTLFKIPDTSLTNSYANNFSITLQPGQPVVTNKPSETTFNLKGAQLRTIVVKSGFINFYIKSYVHEVTNFIYSLPCATKNGVPFTININVPAAVGNTPGVYNQTSDMSGYVLSLTGINNNKFNTLSTALTALVSPAGKPVLIKQTDSLIIKNTFQDFIPYYAQGYFGQSTFNEGPTETNFSGLKNIVNGSIQLEDVKFNLSIENPVGLDARIFINNLNSINTRKGTNIGLVNSVVGSPININRAAESGGIVYPTYANFPLNTSNSNIKALLENLPDKFSFSMQMTTNPLGNIAGSNDFIYSDKLLKAILEMEIPLSFVATNLTLVDTVDLKIGNKNGTNNLKSGTITMIADNGFPFDAALQIYMLNDNNAITDSLFTGSNTILKAPLNTSYRAIGKTTTTLIIPVSESKMNALYNTKKIVFKTIYNTSNQPQYMKIYSDYGIDLKLIGDINYTVQLK
jgi:hypothetical protein